MVSDFHGRRTWRGGGGFRVGQRKTVGWDFGRSSGAVLGAKWGFNPKVQRRGDGKNWPGKRAEKRKATKRKRGRQALGFGLWALGGEKGTWTKHGRAWTGMDGADGAGERAQPRLGLETILARLPRVARASQPWARWCNPFGIEANGGGMAAPSVAYSGGPIGDVALRVTV